MIASLAKPLMIAAAIGWAGCIVVSLLSLGGVAFLDAVALMFFAGVFPLWFYAVWRMQRDVHGFLSKGWSYAFRGCPRWLRYAIWGTWGYGALSMFLFPGGPFQTKGLGITAMFYATSLGIIMTMWVTRHEPTQCPKGHSIEPVDNFCRQCGAEIKRTNSVPLVS
ncbi:MAG: hypothetical protein AB7O98_17110 [Hyphomonadaceae bacterium]